MKTTLGYLALPVLLLVACVVQPTPAVAQMTSVGIDCSQIQALGIQKQENLAAGKVLIECGLAQGGGGGKSAISALRPPDIQVSNRTCTSSTSCTKSENMVSGNVTNPLNIVVNYNDHNAGQYSGTSVSNDGGATFTEILPPPLANGHGTNFGDPIVVYNAKLGKFFAGDLVTSCGSLGVGTWSSTDGTTWTVGPCAANTNSGDRESMWVDNEPTSGTYGRMYVSYNDFTIGSGALAVVSSDDGVKWNKAVIVNNGATFIRDVQITGSPVGATRYEGANSTVFIAGMNEGGGGCANRINMMYKSLDGGVTWTTAIMGASFKPICDALCSSNSYFAQVNPIIRHMGWGEPAVGPNGVVHYVYAGLGTNGDPGDIFYTKSTDNGVTWSVGKKLNGTADAAFKTQWMPSLSADAAGGVTASWYDRRKATSKCTTTSDPGCSYERVLRQSTDNGTTFGPPKAVSGIIPQPTQNDPSVVSCYAGDYDYDTTLNGNAFITWTDGTRTVGGVHVQDVDFATVPTP